MIIPLRFGNVMYYDGSKFRKQDEGFVTPNGIVLTPDKK
jgi:sugar lactone lactonase YvrE